MTTSSFWSTRTAIASASLTSPDRKARVAAWPIRTFTHVRC
jgi:hypothetical protein